MSLTDKCGIVSHNTELPSLAPAEKDGYSERSGTRHQYTQRPFRASFRSPGTQQAERGAVRRAALREASA